MISACLQGLKISRLIGFSGGLAASLLSAGSVFAQTTSPTTAPSTGGGGTSGALPNAGSTELTYLIFLVGALFFVFGTIKFVFSFRE